VRLSARNLSRTPVFSLGAIVVLALGIGVNSAIFSVNTGMSRIVQRFEDPEELVFLWGAEPGWNRSPVSALDYVEWRDQAAAFQEMGVHKSSVRYLTGSGEPQRLSAVHASVNLLPMLGLHAEVGRLFGLADTGPTASSVAVITHRLWVEHFDGTAEVLGQTVTLSDNPYTIVGILPKTVEFEMLWRDASVFLPLELNTAELTWEDRQYSVIGRLMDDATVQQAQTQLTAIASRLAESQPQTNQEVRAIVEPFESFFYSNDDKLAMALLMAAVVAVLLIASVNLANVLLAKGSARQGEIAIRLAMGASRWRMVRQLLTESLFLSLVGGIAGIYLAQLGVRLLLFSFASQPFLPEEIGLDAALLTFSALVSAAAALAFGLTPALLSTRVSLAESVKETMAGASSSRSRKRFRSWLLVAQLAMTVPLVLTCVIAYLNVTGLERLDMGFSRDGLLTMRVDLPTHRYRDYAQRAAFFSEATEMVKAAPGVESAAVSTSFPIGAGQRSMYAPMIVQGRETLEGSARGPYGFQSVSPEYFTTLGVQMRSGRSFEANDGAADPQVAIVNEAFAAFYWPEEIAVGKQLTPVQDDASRVKAPDPITVVGVVADFGATFHGDPPRPTMYRPQEQAPLTWMLLVARTSADPGMVFPQLRDLIRQLDDAVPISQLRTSEAVVDLWLQESRVIAVALGLLGILALGLATVGLYGMVAYSVAQRTYELGIRMVLGADRFEVRLAVMRSFLMLSGIGLAVGLAISLAMALVMRSQLVLLQVMWVPSVLGIVTLLILVVMLASYVPARRATTIEPALALRYE